MNISAMHREPLRSRQPLSLQAMRQLMPATDQEGYHKLKRDALVQCSPLLSPFISSIFPSSRNWEIFSLMKLLNAVGLRFGLLESFFALPLFFFPAGPAPFPVKALSGSLPLRKYSSNEEKMWLQAPCSSPAMNRKSFCLSSTPDTAFSAI